MAATSVSRHIDRGVCSQQHSSANPVCTTSTGASPGLRTVHGGHAFMKHSARAMAKIPSLVFDLEVRHRCVQLCFFLASDQATSDLTGAGFPSP